MTATPDSDPTDDQSFGKPHERRRSATRRRAGGLLSLLASATALWLGFAAPTISPVASPPVTVTVPTVEVAAADQTGTAGVAAAQQNDQVSDRDADGPREHGRGGRRF